MQVNPRDLAAGAVFIAIGLFFGLNAWFNLKIGEAFSMGPGYFPVVLGFILVCFGLGIAATALGRPRKAIGPVSWRGVALVTAAVVFFALTVRGLGVAPALFGAGVMAGLSSRRMSTVAAVALSVCLTTFCVVVFVYALRLPYRVIGPWLMG